LIGLPPKDEQVNISHAVGKIFMCFVISILFGVVAAAIQGNVDCEDYISHFDGPDFHGKLGNVTSIPDFPTQYLASAFMTLKSPGLRLTSSRSPAPSMWPKPAEKLLPGKRRDRPC